MESIAMLQLARSAVELDRTESQRHQFDYSMIPKSFRYYEDFDTWHDLIFLLLVEALQEL